MKKHFSILASFVLLFAAGPVMAAEVTNVSTGADSVNESSIKVENEAEVKIHNSADVKNQITAESNTGKNEVEKNTGEEDGDNVSASIETGDAETTVSVENDVNANDVSVDMCCEADEDENGGVSPGEEEFPPEEGGGVAPAEEEFALAEEAGGVAAAEFLPEAGVEGLVIALVAAALLTAAIRLKKMSAKIS